MIDLNSLLTADDRCHVADLAFREGKYDKAEQLFVSAIDLDPKHIHARNNLAQCLIKNKQYDLSEKVINGLLLDQPNNSDALNTKGLLTQNMGHYNVAEAYFAAALASNMANQTALINYAYLSQVLGKFEQAYRLYTRARDLNPLDFLARFWRSMTMITLAHDKPEMWPDALSEYEVRQALYALDLPRNGKLIYSGQETLTPDDSILIVREQGIGDFVMMARYARFLKDKYGVKVYALVSPHWKAMCGRFDGFDGVFDNKEELPDYTYHIPAISLLRATGFPRVEADNFPYMGGKRMLAMPSDRKRIGVCWQGNKDHANDAFRSIPWDVISPYIERASQRFDVYSLQTWDVTEALPGYVSKVVTKDLDTLAGLIQSMDLVISVDSAPAHIAGALGIPCRLLIPPNNDWRWHRGAKETLWYPFTRVYQAQRPKRWSAVLDEAFTVTGADLIGDFLA